MLKISSYKVVNLSQKKASIGKSSKEWADSNSGRRTKSNIVYETLSTPIDIENAYEYGKRFEMDGILNL